MKSANITVFGIKNCDTMKKARAWLDANKIDYRFHDYKTSGIDVAHLKSWCKTLGWETVLNRAGATFKKLPDVDKENLNECKAIALMIAQPSVIKRPMLALGQTIVAGFKPERDAELFSRDS